MTFFAVKKQEKLKNGVKGDVKNLPLSFSVNLAGKISVRLHPDSIAFLAFCRKFILGWSVPAYFLCVSWPGKCV